MELTETIQKKTRYMLERVDDDMLDWLVTAISDGDYIDDFNQIYFDCAKEEMKKRGSHE